MSLHTADGELRGCIGHVAPDFTVGEVVRRVAVSAARADPRFPAVTPQEMAGVRIEISVLGDPVPLAPREPGRVVIGRDGVGVRRGQRYAVLLPQVAPEHGFDGVAFLRAVCEKAGLSPDAWREPHTEVFTFSAHVLAE